jgi:RNA polymerase sigma-70 factor (ECF subfamily)
MTIPSTHASLLLALQNPEKKDDAWAMFDALYRGVVFGWIRRQGLQEHDAEDLTQEVLMKLLFRELPRFIYDPNRGKFRSWLKTVVTRATQDVQRRQQPVTIGGSAFWGVLANLESPHATDELSDQIEPLCQTALAVVDRVRAHLEETTWQSFYQWQILERPAAEVARELGLTVGAVWKNAARVTKRLIEENSHVHLTN